MSIPTHGIHLPSRMEQASSSKANIKQFIKRLFKKKMEKEIWCSPFAQLTITGPVKKFRLLNSISKRFSTRMNIVARAISVYFWNWTKLNPMCTRRIGFMQWKVIFFIFLFNFVLGLLRKKKLHLQTLTKLVYYITLLCQWKELTIPKVHAKVYFNAKRRSHYKLSFWQVLKRMNN